MMQDLAKKHQVQIARSTLKLTDSGARIMGGMTKQEARKLLASLNTTGQTQAAR